MLLKNKKAAIPTIKILVIILTITILFISYAIILIQSNSLTIEDKKLQTQIIQNKIFNSNCFSDEYAIIEENKFTQENFEACFENLPKNSAFKIQISGKPIININKDIYEQKENYCSLDSNLLCTTMKYPITLKSNNGELEPKMLVITTIIN